MRLPSPRLIAAVLATAALGGCATNPVTGKQDVVLMSEAQEIQMGREANAQIMQEYTRYDDEALQAYVNQVGQRIAAASHRPNLQYTFTVLDSPEVNAFAVPGYIYITRGIMAYLNSEAELVAVLGHEVGHVTARHAVRQQTGAAATGVGATVIGILTGSGDLANVANMAGTALVSGYGRDKELEADNLGAQYVARLGYDPDAMIDVVRLLKNQESFEIQQARAENRKPHIYHGLFATHPDNDTRLQEAIKAAHKAGDQGQYPDGRQVYLDHVKGLPFGSSAAQGIVRGSRFYPADMGFTLAFPGAWTIDNAPSKVVAYPTQKDAFLELYAMPVPPNVGPREFLARNLQGVTLTSSEPLQVNGLQGYAAVAQSVKLPWGNYGPARFAVVYLNNMAYVFRGATRVGSSMAGSDPLFMSSIRTFRRLKDNEFALAEPQRIELMQATPRTRIESLATSSPIRPYPAEQLRLLNDLYPDKEPAPGQTLKIVN